ncbi:MAG TPA: tetratricopeptide repeat protein [Polyangiaceae bacterium]|nr:tetratricopeptide repeat protein [Polyangiaceae bacterium]
MHHHLGCFLILAMCACARQHSTPFMNERAEAERHYAHGRYSKAAASWREAARHAEHHDDRVEALYRAGAAEQRAGESAAARDTYLEVLELAPHGPRAARAAFELAWLDIEGGDTTRGEQNLLAVTLRYQDSALAGRAFIGLMNRLEKRGGPAAALALVDRVRPQVHEPELAEQVDYAQGRLLRTTGQAERARDVFLKLAQDFPYPQGAYWEDALWHAADIEREQGRPRAALAHLERMLREVEPAHFQGSYARTRYAEAQYRIAEIYRDDLRQPQRARGEFRKVFDEHPTSLLRDDALWQEALIGRATNEAAARCDALKTLVTQFPDSRYTPCAPLLCSHLPKTNSERTCRAYIRRALEAGRTSASGHAPLAPDEIQSSK